MLGINHYEVCLNLLLRAGHTYERSLIEEWLKKHDTSPSTNEKLQHLALAPNYIIRQMLKLFAARLRVKAGTSD